jgi:hypothetical protein
MGTSRRGTGGIRRVDPAALFAVSASLIVLSAVPAMASSQPTMSTAQADLSSLSIEELANIDISSVSKTDQPLSEAPAAIYVITHEEIRSFAWLRTSRSPRSPPPATPSRRAASTAPPPPSCSC